MLGFVFRSNFSAGLSRSAQYCRIGPTTGDENPPDSPICVRPATAHRTRLIVDMLQEDDDGDGNSGGRNEEEYRARARWLGITHYSGY
jgi:hypothetical protein